MFIGCTNNCLRCKSCRNRFVEGIHYHVTVPMLNGDQADRVTHAVCLDCCHMVRRSVPVDVTVTVLDRVEKRSA